MIIGRGKFKLEAVSLVKRADEKGTHFGVKVTYSVEVEGETDKEWELILWGAKDEIVQALKKALEKLDK